MTAGVPVVDASAGVVRGGSEGGVAVFRGIPYAEPPVGLRRFGAPEPVGRWDGVRDATAFGPPPPQGGALGMGALWRDEPGDDWLTV
ncbi:carboxylesterase family protein, partial [Kitasatospora sp. NPDC093558]|uniref:carboxylesterase family protein n=1 Tax=Kitasatospora sp. NPDC093558 TaxID=3155201 RepID=UPI0034338ECB